MPGPVTADIIDPGPPVVRQQAKGRGGGKGGADTFIKHSQNRCCTTAAAEGYTHLKGT